MAPPPEEINGESTSSEAHRCLPTPFLTKTYQLVDDLSIDDIISWNEDGSAFIVWRPVEFARDLLPKYFKHNNFASFVRQLNTYGFRKIVPDRWEFANDCFKRGEKKLLCEIHRRKISSAVISTATAVIPAPQVGSPTNSSDEQVISSNSPPVPAPCRTSSSTADLADENDRLRKENLQLNQELTQMKNLCNNIFVLMTKYAGGCNRYAETSFPAEKELDLLPVARRFLEEPDNPAESGVQGRGAVMAEEETRPKLFGVPIGVKRVRGEDELQQPVGPAEEVKSEPLDSRSDQQDPHWLTRYSRQKSKCL